MPWDGGNWARALPRIPEAYVGHGVIGLKGPPTPNLTAFIYFITWPSQEAYELDYIMMGILETGGDVGALAWDVYKW